MSDTIDHAEEPKDDIRSAILAAMEPAEEAVVDAEPEAKPERSERARGADGKFVKSEEPEAKPEVAEQTEIKADKDPKTEAKEAPEAAEKAPAPTGREPPANWALADKQVFAALPDNAKDFLLRRHGQMEADYTRKTQEIAAFRKDYEPIQALLAPHADAMKARGFTPASLIQNWANLEQQLVSGQGVAVIARAVQAYNIDRAQVAQALGLLPAPQGGQGATQAPAQTHLPPEVTQTLQRLEAWRAEQERMNAYRAQQEHEAAATRVVSDIEAFKSETDSSGALKHPYFADVEQHMAHQVEIAKASRSAIPTLSEMYDNAVWANPSIRDRLLADRQAAVEAQHAKAEAARKEEARAKAVQAQRAGRSVTGSPGTAGRTGRTEPQSLRDQIAAAVEEAEAA